MWPWALHNLQTHKMQLMILIREEEKVHSLKVAFFRALCNMHVFGQPNRKICRKLLYPKWCQKVFQSLLGALEATNYRIWPNLGFRSEHFVHLLIFCYIR